MEKLYQNKEWLYDQYIKLGKSSLKIARNCNCCPKTIIYWLIKFEIERRDNSKAQLIRNPNVKYKNKKWLYQKYIIEEYSMQDIGEMCNVNAERIRIWLTKYGIQTRSHTESLKTGRYIKKMSDARKGKPTWNKGKTDIYSPETLKLMSKNRKGKTLPEETRQKMSEKWKQKYENGYVAPNKGKPTWNKGKTDIYSPETLKLMSKNREGKCIGENNPNWNPNRAERYAPYGENFYDDQLRNQRWELQGGRDLLTGQKLEYGLKSHYHHIDWRKENDSPENHIWLNSSNHMRVHSKKRRRYYESLLLKNLSLLKQGAVPETWKPKNKEMFRQENLVQLKLPIHHIIIEKEWCYGD